MSPPLLDVRLARPEDAPALLSIYAPYVKETAISFETEVPPLAQFARRIADTLQKYPYLTAWEKGEVIGYAYASAFKSRRAYDHSAEASIYLRQDCRGRGVGRRLYGALEEILRRQNITNLYATIAYPPQQEDPFLTRDSAFFHSRMGFAEVAHFHACACKFGRWYDMICMEKPLQDHRPSPPAVLAFPEVQSAFFGAKQV